MILRMAQYRPAWLRHWLERHRSPRSLWLHVFGIPLTIAAVALAGWQLALWRWDLWWRPAGLLALGYLLQWLGHRHERNDMGELILVKRLLGRPYVGGSPRFSTAAHSAAERSAPKISAPDISAPDISEPEISEPEISELEAQARELFNPQKTPPRGN